MSVEEEALNMMMKVLKFILRPFALLGFILFKIGGIWLILGALSYVVGYDYFRETNPLLCGLLMLIGIVVVVLGFPIALLNKIISKIKKEKVNILASLFYKITGRSKGKVDKGYIAQTKDFKYSQPQGTVLAKEKGKYICIPNDKIYHSTICGGTGSGKTVELISTCLSFNGSMLILDGKDGGEIRRKTADYRQKYFNHNIKWFNPEKADTYTFNPYSAFEYINEPEVDIADMISISIIEKSISEKNPMWVDNARILLSGAILWGRAKGMSFNKTIEEIQSHTARDLIANIKKDYDSNPEIFKDAWLKVSFMHSEIKEVAKDKFQVVGMAQETLSGIESNLRSKLSCFTSPNVQRALREDYEKEIRPTDLEDGNCTIYFNVALSKASDQWKAISKLFLGIFFNYFSRRGEIMAENEEKGNKIIFMLDEMVSYGKIDNLDTMVALLRSAYVSIILCYQTFSKVDEIYGEKVRRTLFDNMSANVVLNCNDPDTSLYFAKQSGKYEKKKKSKSSNYHMNAVGLDRGQGNGTSINYEEHYLFREDTFAHLVDEDKLILYLPSGCKKLDKVKYYKDKAFRDNLAELSK